MVYTGVGSLFCNRLWRYPKKGVPDPTPRLCLCHLVISSRLFRERDAPDFRVPVCGLPFVSQTGTQCVKPPSGKSSMPPQLPHRAQPHRCNPPSHAWRFGCAKAHGISVCGLSPVHGRAVCTLCAVRVLRKGALCVRCVRFESCARARCVYAVCGSSPAQGRAVCTLCAVRVLRKDALCVRCVRFESWPRGEVVTCRSCPSCRSGYS
jgi:hypothetical protein